MPPEVTVIMPVYNGMPCLAEAIQSLQQQTLPAFEVFVLDDGSVDDTPALCAAIDDRRFKYVRLCRSGLPAALNHGLQLASSPLIARMDADDIAYPERLRLQAQFMQDNPACVLVGCYYDKIDQGGGLISAVRPIIQDHAIRYRMMFSTSFLHPGAMFRRDAALKLGGYNTSYSTAQDYELWSRLICLGEVATVPEVLMKYRQNPSGVSSCNRVNQVSNASTIAANYARSLGFGISREDWFSFHRFLVSGELCASFPMKKYVLLFNLAYRRYASCDGEDKREVDRVAVEFGQILSWRIRGIVASRSFTARRRFGAMNAYFALRRILSKAQEARPSANAIR